MRVVTPSYILYKGVERISGSAGSGKAKFLKKRVFFIEREVTTLHVMITPSLT